MIYALFVVIIMSDLNTSSYACSSGIWDSSTNERPLTCYGVYFLNVYRTIWYDRTPIMI